MVSPEHKMVASEVVSLFSTMAPVVAVLSTVFFGLWAMLRARSAHFLLDKVWRVVGGGTIYDNDLKADWGLIRDLEGFRFRTGIKFNSKAVWSKTIRWLEANDRSISELSLARAWIIGKPWQFRKPWLKSIKLFAFVVFLGAVPTALFMTTIFSEKSVILTVKQTGTTFWTDGVTADEFKLAWTAPGFSISVDNCEGDMMNGLQVKDFEVICSSLGASAMPALKRFIWEQKLLSGYIVLVCIFLLVLVVRYIERAKMAKIFYGLQ